MMNWGIPGIKAVSKVVLCSALLAGCQTTDNSAGRATIDLDPSTRGPVAGIGIESQDIISMSDRMLRDMLANPILAGAASPPQVLVDSSRFKNESSQRLNKNAITDRLRIGLIRAARGRMIFVSRESMEAVHQERSLKREGVTDVGTAGLVEATAGVDYFLTGRITTQDSRDSRTGYVQRFTQISFEMIDAERGIIVWGGLYDFSRAAADDVVYR